MRGRLISTFMLLQLALLPCFSEALAAYPAASATTLGVVLYPDRAMVRKALRVSLSQGETRVEVSGLTPSVIDNSVQAGIRGGGKARIVDIEVRRTSLVKPEQEPANRLQDRLEKLDRDIVRKENDLAVVKNSLAFLQRVMPFPDNQATSFAVVQAYVGSLEQAMTERMGKIFETEQAIVELKKQRADVAKEIETIGPESDRSKSLLVTLQSDSALAVDLEYSYFLSDVSWTPKYEVRADSGAQRIELNFFAIVQQASGEDLSARGIEISTAQPAVSGELPELAPWRLDVYTPPVYRDSYSELSRARGMLEDMAAPEPETMAASVPAPAEVKSEATSMSYVLSQQVAIPSDNQPHKILVSNSAGEAVFTYRMVPKLAKFASLTAELKNPFVFPLLGGELNVFLDGRFVSTRTVDTPVMAGDDLKLALGLDETIHAVEKAQKQFTEEIGALSKQTRKHFESRIEIVNGKSRPIELVVLEQVPISGHEDIRVELLEPSAGAVEIDDQGIITRILKLQPGARQPLATRFTVTYPADTAITGI